MGEVIIAFLLLVAYPGTVSTIALLLMWSHYRWVRKVRIDRDFALNQYRFWFRTYAGGSVFVYIGADVGTIRVYPHNWQGDVRHEVDIVRTL